MDRALLFELEHLGIETASKSIADFDGVGRSNGLSHWWMKLKRCLMIVGSRTYHR